MPWRFPAWVFGAQPCGPVVDQIADLFNVVLLRHVSFSFAPRVEHDEPLRWVPNLADVKTRNGLLAFHSK